MSRSVNICFVLDSNELQMEGEKLKKSSKYFEELIESSEEFHEIRMILPEWISLKPFKVYLAYVETLKIPKVDLPLAQKLLWLGDFFKDSFLQNTLINTYILPCLNRESVLMFVQDSCTKVSMSSEVLECWIELYKESCQYAASNLRYLLSEKYSVFVKLDQIALREIFDRASKTTQISELLPKLQEIKEAKSPAELMSRLQKEVIQDFKSMSSYFLVLDWSFDDFEIENFYKESDVFKIGNEDWVLFLSCYEHEKRLEISLKLSDSKKDKRVSVITSLVLFQNESVKNTDPQVFPIPSYSNPPVIREINLSQVESSKINIKVYARSEELLSLMTDEYLKNPLLLKDDIFQVPSCFFLTLLKSKFLNIENEDQALDLLAQWTEFQDQEIPTAVIQSLNDSILWEFVSAKQLVSMAFNYQKFKKIEVFKNSIKKELENKMKKIGSKIYLEETRKGRKSYSKQCTREFYPNQKEYFGLVLDLILDIDTSEKIGKGEMREDNTGKSHQDFDFFQISAAESMSPIPQLKLNEEESSLSFTPGHFTSHLRSRNSSNEGLPLRSIERYKTQRKSRNAGNVIEELMYKLKAAKKFRQ